MTRVKMCGITRAEDAALAAAYGADAVGVVFWARSPRAVTVEQAATIAAVLPPFVTLVGVFVDEPPDVVERVVRAAGLGAVQLHGHETPSSWTTYPGPVLRAVGVGPDFDAETLRRWPERVVPVLDAVDEVRRGGTGTRAEWTAARRAALVRPVVLAGGLTPDNVGDAIRAVRPAAVDVSSGIERAPGVKDAARMRAFLRAVREADQAESS